MLATVALSAAAVVVVGLLVWAFLRHDRADETERFHRAREITTSWAAPGPQVHDTVQVDQAAPSAGAVDDAGAGEDVVALTDKDVTVKRDAVRRDAVKRGASRGPVAGDDADPG